MSGPHRPMRRRLDAVWEDPVDNVRNAGALMGLGVSCRSFDFHEVSERLVIQHEDMNAVVDRPRLVARLL